MKSKTKNILTNTLLIVMIFFLVWIGYVGFIGGPAQAYKESDRYYMEAITDYQSLDSARLLNRYALDKVYYIIEAEKDGVVDVAWFDEYFKSYKTYGSVSLEAVYEVADGLEIDHDHIHYGVVQDELVYVLRDKNYNEIYISIEDLKVVELNGGK